MAPLTDLTGRSAISASFCGLAFISISLSSEPILAVPLGRMRFWTLIALTTSVGESPRALSLFGSISTIIWGILPP